MFRLMRCFLGFFPDSPPSRRLLDASPPSSRTPRLRPQDMLETVFEIGIYIHRFHNLDLFQQGWYQVRISLKWEDSARVSCATPARVVQYEAPDLPSDDTVGVWRIDDTDHSFSTQPFRIKYARQDIPLSVMVSFNLSLGRDESPSMSAVILKFELMYAPVLEQGLANKPNLELLLFEYQLGISFDIVGIFELSCFCCRIEMQASFDAFPAAVHEFRIPPKALLGLHSYCPVRFDAFHSVLVDLSVHIVLLKAGAHTPSKKVSSNSHVVEDAGDESFKDPSQVLNQGVALRAIELVKSLLISRGMLLEELHKMSKATGQTVEDLTEADLNLGMLENIGSSLKPDLPSANVGAGMKMGVGQLASILQNTLEQTNSIGDFGNDVLLYSLTKEELMDVFFFCREPTFVYMESIFEVSQIQHDGTEVMCKVNKLWTSGGSSWSAYDCKVNQI